jgi:hypothetical protein
MSKSESVHAKYVSTKSSMNDETHKSDAIKKI